MKTHFLLIFFLLFSIITKAQSNFKKAYILLSENDTVYGEIDDKDYYKNSLSCNFRKDKNDSVKIYLPNDLYGYKFIDGKYYVSKTIKEGIKDTSFFFEFLIKSNLNVYFLQNKFENNYYVSKDGVILNKLKYINEDIYIDHRKMHREDKQFIGLLNYYTEDCPELKKDIQKIAKPNHKNLIKLSKKYNDLSCPDGECIIFEKKIPHHYKVKVNSAYNYIYYSKIVNDTSFSYMSYGFDFLFQLSKQRERFYAGIGIKYSDIKNPTDFYKNKIINMFLLSFYYLHPRQGFSPMFKISFELPFFIYQNYGLGVQFKYKKMSFFSTTELKTAFVIYPVQVSQNAGIIINF